MLKIPAKDRMILPKPMGECETLGVAAPAGRFDPAALKEGLAVLAKMGFRTVLPEGLFESCGYLAGTDAHRAALIHEMFSDDAIDGIICARGGYGSMRILPMLDLDLVRKNPKPFIGFSDITALLNTLYFKGGLVTYHGPVVTTLAGAPVKTRKALLKVLSRSEVLEFPSSGSSVIRPGKAEGILMGGNLTTLCHLVGTPFAPRYQGVILFLEDKGEPPYRIDRMLAQMRLSGCFKGIAGVALGDFVDCGKKREICDIVRECLAEHRIPILGGFEIGHGKINRTVPIGLPAILDTDRRSLVVKWP